MRFDELSVGMQAAFSKTVTETDVVLFAGVTGDLNPMHVNEVEAGRSRFGGRIAHGMLTASFLCPVLGMHLPGPGTIHLEQHLRFLHPVCIGDTVTARAEVTELFPERRRARLRTWCENQDGLVVVEGEALVLVPAAPPA
ncbi:MAG TPA: MaoC family dehydratase [Longimicrobium sp.]|nr:MaoC family dehydratase [Longimicrobium sp.]